MGVVKRIEPWSTYAAAAGVDFDVLAKLYEATANAQGVVHAVQRPELKKGKDKYTVGLQPVGWPYQAAIPACEDDLCKAAHGLLHGLDAIHEVWCHRVQRRSAQTGPPILLCT